MTDAILIGLVLLPAVITFLLKSNAALSFLALSAGFVAISFASTDLQNLTGQMSFSIDSNTLNLLLLSVPLLLTLLVTKKSTKGQPKLIIHVLIGLGAGGLLALISVPLLSSSLGQNFASSDLWTQLQKIQASIVGAGVFLSLVVIWVENLKHHTSGKKHK
jgi:hypothetical protein